MKKTTSLLILCAIVNVLTAQMNYTISFPTATYVAIAGTSPTLTMAYPLSLAAAEGVTTADEGAANNIVLPFTFKYNGINYNTCHISTNGFIALGSQKIDTFSVYWNNNLTNGPINGAANNSIGSRPIIAPLWDDLDLQAVTNLKYTTTGTLPNRIFTVQWSNVKWSWQGTAAAINFQVKLYEVDNSILFHYKTSTGALTSASASIGLTDVYTGTDNFLSLNGVTNTAKASGTTETIISAKPATNFL